MDQFYQLVFRAFRVVCFLSQVIPTLGTLARAISKETPTVKVDNLSTRGGCGSPCNSDQIHVL